jgi:osmotically-inducible protein OsmY
MNIKSLLSLGLLAGALSISLLGCQSSPTQESTGQYIDSSVVTTKVKAALLNASDVDSSNISVITYKGVVQLSGFVNSSEQKAKAAEVAAGVSGVQSVQNDLIVK